MLYCRPIGSPYRMYGEREEMTQPNVFVSHISHQSRVSVNAPHCAKFTFRRSLSALSFDHVAFWVW